MAFVSYALMVYPSTSDFLKTLKLTSLLNIASRRMAIVMARDKNMRIKKQYAVSSVFDED
jgi:hypothetical protein